MAGERYIREVGDYRLLLFSEQYKALVFRTAMLGATILIFKTKPLESCYRGDLEILVGVERKLHYISTSGISEDGSMVSSC
jgi:hypothetical protein